METVQSIAEVVESPPTDPAAERARVIRRGAFRALCAVPLSAVLGFVLAPQLDVTGTGVTIMLGLGGWIGLCLFPQALLEHVLAPGSRGALAWVLRVGAVFACAWSCVIVALSQGTALGSLLAGDQHRALQHALDFVRWLSVHPAQGSAMVFALAGPLAWQSTLELAGVRSAGLRSVLLANLVGAPPLYVALSRKDAAVFIGILLAISLALPALRLLGDGAEARWTRWREAE